MRIKNISLEELEMPYGCKLEIQEIMERKGIPAPITLPIMSANAAYLRKTAALSTLDALVNALEREGINPTVVNYFVKEDGRRKKEKPAEPEAPIEVVTLPEVNAEEIAKSTATIKEEPRRETTIERINYQIELLQELKANLERNKAICEELAKL